MTDHDDVFSAAGDDWHNRALLGYTRDAPWWAYAEGYKEAGDRLVAGIDAGQHGQDFLVFPILFLYRHYLELTIKGQIRECQLLLGIKRPSNPKSAAQRTLAAQGHSLAELWAYLQQLVPHVYPDLPGTVVSEIDRVVQAFANLDPGGDEARYPLTRTEERTLLGLREINLRRLSENISRAEAGFVQIEGGIDWEIEHRQFEAEIRSEMEAERRAWELEYLGLSGP